MSFSFLKFLIFNIIAHTGGALSFVWRRDGSLEIFENNKRIGALPAANAFATHLFAYYFGPPYVASPSVCRFTCFFCRLGCFFLVLCFYFSMLFVVLGFFFIFFFFHLLYLFLNLEF